MSAEYQIRTYTVKIDKQSLIEHLGQPIEKTDKVTLYVYYEWQFLLKGGETCHIESKRKNPYAYCPYGYEHTVTIYGVPDVTDEVVDEVKNLLYQGKTASEIARLVTA